MTRQNDEWGTTWQHRDDPVFQIDSCNSMTYPNGDTLPGIWITQPIKDGKGGYDGRTYMMIYPLPSLYENFFPESDPDDADGEIALYYGGGYYDEGMGYTDPADHAKRVDCFKAAEVLYRHAAGRGNAVANLCLGYVYSYDRCEGDYYRGAEASGADGRKRPYPREERAFECLSIAAEADIPEACYKLGDMYKHGTGCDPDAAEAFRWYVRASELAVRESPVILGSVALRLAGCYEEGFGCNPDFTRALDWYEKAIDGLEAAVDGGAVWYEKALIGARAGAKRCRQELQP